MYALQSSIIKMNTFSRITSIFPLSITYIYSFILAYTPGCKILNSVLWSKSVKAYFGNYAKEGHLTIIEEADSNLSFSCKSSGNKLINLIYSFFF